MESPHVLIGHEGIDRLIELLEAKGYEVCGPKVGADAIVYDVVHSTADLPVGWRDVQDAGKYRLERRDDDAMFGYVLSPESLKRFLHPPDVAVWTGTAGPTGVEKTPLAPPTRRAILGVRPCDLAAAAIQDRVFLGGPLHDDVYETCRNNTLIVAVDCTEPGATCFCTSMGTGPGATDGYDIAITELPDHRFLVRAGSEMGSDVVDELGGHPAGMDDIDLATSLVEEAAGQMGRSMDTSDVKDLLYRNVGSPHWDDVARRCLTCGNCTMVCPTCFCASVDDSTSMDGTEATRTRRWDSCFTLDFSYIHGGSVRTSGAARYRQWLTHKLGSWQDQFGEIGCVGCGRCITWCPVGIDLTEEIVAIRWRELAELDDPQVKEVTA